jgi:hypothetical protein
MEETGVPGENHWSVARNWQIVSLNVVYIYLQILLDKSIIEILQPRFDQNYSLLTVLKLLIEDDRSTIKQHCFHLV